MNRRVLYLGDGTLSTSARYLAGVLTYHRIPFDHVPTGRRCTGGALRRDYTLFINACGRTDLPGGDSEQMYLSLTQRLARLPDETMLYPGHNYADRPASTLKDERQNNPFLLHQSLESFLMMVRGF